MASTITLSLQHLEVTEVGDVIVTDAAQDETYGDWVRDIRIYSEAPTGGTATLLVQVRIRAADQESLQITAPAQSF